MFYDFLRQDLSLHSTDVIKVKYVCSKKVLVKENKLQPLNISWKENMENSGISNTYISLVLENCV